MTNELVNTASACLECTRDRGMTKCSGHLCGCTDCEIHHRACVRVSIPMCRSRPSLSSDVWAQWLVVFLSEAPIVLCVGHACKLIHAFIRNVREELNALGTKSFLISCQRLLSSLKSTSSLVVLNGETEGSVTL